MLQEKKKKRSVSYKPIIGKAKDLHLSQDKASSVNNAGHYFLFYEIAKAASSCLLQTDG